MYENELMLISKMSELNISDRQSANKLYEYVYSCINENNIQITDNIKARIFEYEVVNKSIDRANKML